MTSRLDKGQRMEQYHTYDRKEGGREHLSAASEPHLYFEKNDFEVLCEGIWK